MIGGNILSAGQAAQILFGIFFLLLVLRVPVAVALGLACLPILLIEPRLSPMMLAQETFNAYNSFILLAVREGTHFTVDVFPRLSPRGEAKVELLSGVFVLVFAFVFLWWGWEFTEFAIYRISELAELPLWLIHMAWPIAGLVWILFQAERMLDAAAVLREDPR